MATTPTQNDVPSNASVDLKYNSEQFDRVINGQELFYVDRFGKNRITMYGVEQLANAFEETFTNKLGAQDGYNLIGSVKSFEALRKLRPSVEGQRIFLSSYYEGGQIGGGVFIAHFGQNIDDGGVVAAFGDYYWERVISGNIVTPEMFGAFAEKRATSGMTNQVASLQNAINKAVNIGAILDVSICGMGGSTDSTIGYYVESPVNLTGLQGIRGVLSIFCNGNKFVDTLGYGFCVVIANADYTGTTITGNTTKGNLLYEGIEVRNLSSRSGTVKGILFTAARTVIQKLRANHFNGRGIWMANAYDSWISRAEVENSGNIDEWALDVAFYSPYTGADESNGMSVGAFLVHDCHERAWRVYGSKSAVVNIHEENTISSQSPTSPSAQDTRTSYGYMNSYFSSTGGLVGNISIQPNVSDSTQKHVFAFGAVGTTAGTIYKSSGVTVLMNGDPGSRGGSVNTIYTEDLTIIAGARCTINRVEVSGSFIGRGIRNDSPIMGGYITNVVENVGDMYNVVFRNPVAITPTYSHCYTRCTFNGSPSFNSSARVTLDKCIFPSTLVLTDKMKAEFFDCSWSGGLTVTGSTIDVIFDGGQIGGDLSFSSPTGVWLFPNPPRISGNVTGWVWPTAATLKGSTTRNPAPANTSGTVVEKMYNGSSWLDIIKVA